MNDEVTLSSFLKYRKGKPPRGTDATSQTQLPVLSPEYLRGNGEPELTAFAVHGVPLGGGEIVLLWDGSNAGEFFRAKHGLLASTMVVFDFDDNEIERSYLFYNLKRFEPTLKALTSGSGIPHVDKEILLTHKIRKLDRPVQEKISEVLSTIDQAIKRTEALISKYQRIKTGLMLDLLTRGIDERGRLRDPATHKFKPSALGPIPENWTVATIGELLANVPNAFRSGPFGSALRKEQLKESGIPFLGIDNVHIERFVSNYTRFVDEETFARFRRYAVRPRDVMVTVMGTVGRCCVVPDGIGTALSSKHVWTMTLDQSRVSPALVCWQVNHAPWVFNHFRQDEQGGIMTAIRSDTLRTLRLPVPLPNELRIIESIYTCFSRRLALEAEVLRKTLLLKTGLMQDLLEGKVSVEPLLEAQNAS